MIVQCGRILAKGTRVGVPELRAFWKSASPQARAIIEACAPPEGADRPPQPSKQEQRSPRWVRNSFYRAPSTVTTRREASAQHAPAPRSEEPAIVSDYVHTRAGEADERGPRETPPGYGHDHDLDALAPVRGRCVALACHLEPSTADLAERDGLCSECRELDRPGMDLDPEFTRDQVIRALCAYILEHYPAPVKHLRKAWARCTTEADRATVAAWVTDTVPPAMLAAADESQQLDESDTECGECGDINHLRDGRCVECRKDATATSAPTAVLPAPRTTDTEAEAVPEPAAA